VEYASVETVTSYQNIMFHPPTCVGPHVNLGDLQENYAQICQDRKRNKVYPMICGGVMNHRPWTQNFMEEMDFIKNGSFAQQKSIAKWKFKDRKTWQIYYKRGPWVCC
jgi:hypothetical protein